MVKAHLRGCSERLNVRKSSANEVLSVRKALDLLGAFSFENPILSLSELSRRLKLPKSTAHNLLRTMESFDLVRQEFQSRSYRLGPRAMELGLLAARSDGMLAHARPMVRRLSEETHETVKMGVLSNEQVLILTGFESSQHLHTRADVGRRWPLHSSSLGKAMLAVLGLPEAKQLLEHLGMTRYTDATVTTWERMELEIQAIRTRGYALDLEENEPGVRCVAVPLASEITGEIAAISISVPTVRLERNRLENLAKQALMAARRIAAQSRALSSGVDVFAQNSLFRSSENRG